MTTHDRPIKVLHLITLTVVGGSQDNTFCTAQLHDRQKYEVHLAANPTGQWVKRAQSSCDVFHPIAPLVTSPNLFKDLRAFFQILALIQREKFDIVHTHCAKAGFLGRVVAWISRTPIVIHTYHAFPFHKHMSKTKQCVYRTLEKLVKPCTDYFITVSENERKEGIEQQVLYSNSSKTIYSGINLEKLDKSAPTSDTRQALNIPPDRPIVLMAGRLDQQKAPHLMIEAFSKVIKKHPDALLLIAGDGDLRPHCKETIRSLGLYKHVRLLGFRSDIPTLMQISNIFSLSSLWEGMGRAMTEAMLLGKPVVVPEINGIPEIVHHQETGLLYDAGDVSQLADQLSDLLAQPAEQQRLGENARNLTRLLFDVGQMVHDIEVVYQQLISAKALRTPQRPTTSELAPTLDATTPARQTQ